MDRNTMKNTMKSLKLWVLGCVMLFAGAQSASAALSGCEGTVYFKLPDGWKTAYAVGGGQKAKFTESTYTGWLQISTTSIGAPNAPTAFFIEETGANDCNSGHCATKSAINVKYTQFTETGVNANGFTCKDFGANTNELWIQPSFEDANKPLVQGEPPDVKYFYVFLPDNKIWKSATPVISENGKERALDIDNDHCGWYYRRYVNEELPTEVFIRRDDDEAMKEAIGMGGEKDSVAEVINLKGLFGAYANDEGFNNILYFVADEKKATEIPGFDFGWYFSLPAIEGNCSYNLAAVIYDTDASLHPAFSCWSEGGEGCQGVGSQTAAQGVDKQTALDAIDYCVGVRPGLVEKTLTVDPTTGAKKPKLTAAGKKCFLDAKYFDQLFNYTKGVNEMSCFDMPFHRSDDGKWEFNSDDYVSPGLKVEIPGGFYPVEATTDAIILDTDSTQTQVAAARKKRFAQGPAYYGAKLRAIGKDSMPVIDTYCNGPGWTGGKSDCEGLFGDGAKTEDQIRLDLGLTNGDMIIGWTDVNNAPNNWPLFSAGENRVYSVDSAKSTRWESTETSKNGGRNQHFCFESHANFRFKHGLKFNFRGDDDIWVFIDNKLAVDLGGTHLAAPGYVDLDKFMPSAEVGHTYDIDIFFCDRRTTMSNVRIKTNMFIEQSNGIEYEGQTNFDEWINTGDNEFELCYTQSGAGNCAAMGSKGTRECGENISGTIYYMFTTDPTGTDPAATIYSEEDFAANPIQMDGIIDVSKKGRPRVNEDKLKNSGLSPNTYYLRIRIGSDKKTMSWTIKGNVGVATREATLMNSNGGVVGQLPFKEQAMATVQNPTVDQLIPLYIGSVVDPCTGDATCSTAQKVMPLPNSDYSLQVTDASGKASTKASLYEYKNGVLTKFAAGSKRKLGASGVDTVYITIPFAEMDASTETVFVNVAESSLKAKVSFFAPTLVFVKSETSFEEPDMSKDTTFMKNSPALFYVLALNPDGTPCNTCSFPLASGSKTSPGLTVDSTISVTNGRALVTVVSTKEYYRCSDGNCPGAATLHLTGPAITVMQVEYPNLLFVEPPVPTPLFADIYDVHGELPAAPMNIPAEYFSMQSEYLDGIGDSIVVYYARNFYNHPDSLPEKIAIFWDEEVKDSVVFEKAEVMAGIKCGAEAGLDDTLCFKRVTLGGKKLSKNVKTAGVGKLKSWATFKARGVVVTQDYSCSIYDRIAPIIVSARAMTEAMGGVEMAKLKIEYSEPVQKTTDGEAKGDAVLSFYINNGKEPKFTEYIPLNPGSSIPSATNTNVMNLLYNPTTLFPQSGDYIHFGSFGGVGYFMDKSEYATSYPGADTIRSADDANYKWNVAPGYNATGRLPSPWVLISGDVSAYAVRIIPSAMGGIPKTPSEATNLDPFEVFAFDASKDDDNFRDEIRVGQGEFEKYGYIPHGWYVKTDMGAIIESKEDFANVDKKNVFFDYELSFFTNLGSHVATQKGRIFCDDTKNFDVNHKYYFGGPGANCVANRKNFFIVWNMKSDKNRLVGSGAYITKLKTYVQLDNFGKKNKFDKTEMWGVRHTAKTPGSFPVILFQ